MTQVPGEVPASEERVLATADVTYTEPTGRWAGRLRGAVPPEPAQRIYALAALVDAVGLGLYGTGSIIFFVHTLRFSAHFVGTALTVAALVGLLASLPAGSLSDRVQAKPVVVALMIAQGVLFALFPLVHGRAAFLVIITAVALVSAAIVPTRQVLISDIVDPASRVRLAAYSRAVLNVGVSVGALLASVALASGGRTAFNAILLGNAASCVIAAGLLSRIKVRPRTPAADPGPSDEPAPPDRHPLLQPRLVSAATICGILFLSAAILDVGLPLQVAEHSSAPTWVIGLLLVVNTVMAVTLQVVTSRGAHTVAGAARANRIAGLALLACCLVFPLSSHGPAGPAIVVLIVATVLLTMGELYSSAGSWGLSYGLADTEQEGKYLASFGLLSQFIQVFGPLLATVVVGVGMLGWITVGVVFALSGYLAPKITPG